MSMKTKKLIAALGILALLIGSYAGATAWKKKKAEERYAAAVPSPRLGNLEAPDLVKIDVNGLALEKKGELWELVSVPGNSSSGNSAAGDKLHAAIALDQGQIESLTWSLAKVWAERIVDEKPEDLSVYGLDKPSSITTITDSAGKVVTYLLGNKTPSGTNYYGMEEGDPKLYTIPTYTAEQINFNLDAIRNKNLLPAFDFQKLSRVQIQSSQSRIDISAKPETVPPYLSFSYNGFVMTSPYKIMRKVYNQALYDLLLPLNNLTIHEFVEASPSSLAPYGLDKPVKLFFEADNTSIDLLIGSRVGHARYAMISGSAGRIMGVFTVTGLDAIVNVKPFSLLDKFALILSIDSVEQMIISGEGKTLKADFQGQGDEAVYFLDGKKAETNSFKDLYQKVAGLFADAEIPGSNTAASVGSEDIKIEYLLNTPPGARVSITLVPYDRNFYALKQEGAMELLVSRNQVRSIFETADAVVFAE